MIAKTKAAQGEWVFGALEVQTNPLNAANFRFGIIAGNRMEMDYSGVRKKEQGFSPISVFYSLAVIHFSLGRRVYLY